MIPRTRELLHATPFEPFTVRTSDGHEYKVPTADHAAITPKGSRLIVFADNYSQAEIGALDIAAVLRNGQTLV
ncbi:MAG: hypothetical protein LC627_02785 [Verrucomicrobiaceae bacterium]|nr:hypothetical protein [Verrucomicrobiaceae bacterium]